MEDKNTQEIASQTEIPVENLPPKGKKFVPNLPGVPGKLLVVIIGVVVLVAVIAGVLYYQMNSQPSNIASALREADEAYKSGNYDEAEKIIDDELAKDNNNPELNMSKLLILSARGNLTGTEKESFELSQEYISKLLEGNPTAEALIIVGYAYETAGDYENAFVYYTKATEADPNSSEAWFHRGHAQEFLGRRTEANTDYDKALELNNENPWVLIAIGNRLLAEGKPQESFETFIKASNSPNIPVHLKSEALTAASIVRRSQILYMNEAVDLSRQAVELTPQFSPALGAHGQNLSISGNKTEGIKYLEMAIEANPRITRHYYHIAQAHRVNKNFTEAINYQKEAISRAEFDNTLLSPSEKTAAKGRYTYDLAKTYSMAGMDVDTVPLIREGLTLNPSLKSFAKEDFDKYGFFSELSSNQEYLQLIN